MIKVVSEVEICEVDGEETPVIGGPVILVESHPLSSTLATIQTPDGKRYGVVVADLQRAVRNARQFHIIKHLRPDEDLINLLIEPTSSRPS